MKRTIPAVVAAVVALVTAAVYLGGLQERLDQFDERLDASEERTLEILEEFATTPRTPGPEIQFSNNGPFGTWGDPLYCRWVNTSVA